MAIPFRLHVLRRLSDELEKITPGNGFHHDLTGRVFRGRDMFGEGDPVPMVSLLEAPIPLDQFEPAPDSDIYHGPWELVIQGFCEDDKENPTDPAHLLMADVRRRLAQLKRGAGRHDLLGPWPDDFRGRSPIENMRIGPGVVRPPDKVSYYAYFWLTITLEVVDDLAAPFRF